MIRGFLIAFLATLSFLCSAQVPQTLSYQGLLTDGNGLPVTTTQTNITFNFYTVLNGGSPVETRTINEVGIFKGLFSVVIGNNSGGPGSSNGPLPFSVGNAQYYVGVVPSGGTELTPRVALTTVPYAFMAQGVMTVNADNITAGTLDVTNRIANGSITDVKLAAGIDANKLTNGLLPSARIADGSITNTKLATGIDASKLTIGTLPTTQIADGTITSAKITDLTITTADIASGSVTDAKLATGIDASKLTIGTLPIARIADDAVTSAKITDGTMTTADIANGAVDVNKLANNAINSAKIIDGGIATADIADGAITNAKLASGINASKINAGTIQLSSSAIPDAEGQIRYNSTEKVMEYFNGQNWYFMVPKVAFIKDVKPSSTLTTSTIGNWARRDLNSVFGDSFVTVTSNRFSLNAGEYIVEAVVPSYFANYSRIRLYDVINSTDNVGGLGTGNTYGNSDFAGNVAGGSQVMSSLYSKFTITSTTLFEIQQWLQTDGGTAGFGNAVGGVIPVPNEIYTQVKITKLR